MASLTLNEDSPVSSHLRERIAKVHLGTKLRLHKVSQRHQEGCERENESACEKAEKGR